MKKVTILMGSQQKRATYLAVQEFERYLKSLGEIEFETIFLKEYRLEYCRGCCQCFEKGEKLCPLKDDRDDLLQKISDSDGVIIATPNYSFQIPAPVKNLLDRMSFILHRPRFFGKTFTSIVTQGIVGGAKIQKYLNMVAGNWGFNPVNGCCLTALGTIDEIKQKKINQKIIKCADRFYRQLMKPAPSVPSLFRLMVFRIARNSIFYMQNDEFRDRRYFKENGWFTSAYYYDVSLGIFKKLAGNLFDFIGRMLFKSRGEKMLQTPN